MPPLVLFLLHSILRPTVSTGGQITRVFESVFRSTNDASHTDKTGGVESLLAPTVASQLWLALDTPFHFNNWDSFTGVQ